MSNGIGTVSIELYRLNEYSFPKVSISLYRFFKNLELEYDSIDRLVNDEDLYLSWIMSICSSENADLIKATFRLNGITHTAIYPITKYRSGYDFYLPVPQLTRIKRIYLVYNDLSILNRIVLGVGIQDSNIVLYDLSNDQLYVLSSPVKLIDRSSIKGIVIELEDLVTFVPLENMKRVEIVKRSRKRKKKARRSKKKGKRLA